MLNILKIIKHQGKQFIPDPTKVKLTDIHPGRPVIEGKTCQASCNVCREICPVSAIETSPVTMDLGKCLFCSECESLCPVNKIKFTPDFKISSNDHSLLIVKEGEAHEIRLEADKIRKEIKQCFGHSLKLRLVSSGSCNGCELELNAAGNVNFDMGRYGIEFLASPRHCDGVVITGPVVANSVKALELTYEAIPRPKIIILAGACAVSGGLFAETKAIERSFLENHPPDLLVPGCPPHPLTIMNGILQLITKK
jgi:Ni,Fe-hydrogenase III small subunit/NAD-dependent dihydropyrimidine dehydrogenase PreA subunit